jgi:uncharacterized protein YyaL (SSP411 family)
MADAAMIRLGQTARQCELARTVAFLDLVARPTESGGYYPRANVDGREVTTRDSYADDNALIGLALLEARDASADQEMRARLLRRAERAARFLTNAGLWDDTFGGGFWWNTNRGQMPEGKPAQTTAVAAQLFARLYIETGDPHYADWARASLRWLDDRLFDPASGLYRYGLRHWELSDQSGEWLDPRLFSYDQGIMIEVHLLFDQAIEPQAGHRQRARALAEQLQSRFWDDRRGGYRLDALEPAVFTPYSAWLTQSLLALEAVDPNPVWLDRARANVDALETSLRDPADDGYYHMHFHCRDVREAGCEDGESWSFDPTKYLFSQAWMQRAQALLAQRLAAPAR